MPEDDRASVERRQSQPDWIQFHTHRTATVRQQEDLVGGFLFGSNFRGARHNGCRPRHRMLFLTGRSYIPRSYFLDTTRNGRR